MTDRVIRRGGGVLGRGLLTLADVITEGRTEPSPAG
jgi:hypothetical protein